MDDREFEKILASAEQLRLREKETEPWADRYSDMNSMEKSMLLDELFALRKADKEREAKLLEKLDRMTEQLLALNENSQRLLRQNDELKRMLSDRDALIEKLRKENAALKEQKKLSDKNRFDGKTQKVSSKNRGSDSREADKEDFDGSSTPNLPSEEAGTDLPSSTDGKQDRPYRQGLSYKRMKADKSVCHDSDLCRLLKDAVVIKTFYKYSYEQVSYILEHKYQVVRYKRSDGNIMEGYFPKSGGPDKIDVVPGTHAFAGLQAHARAKFVYAYEQGGDLNAKRMLEYIGWLYGQEDSYRQSGLTAEEKTRQRNSLRTKDVIGRMRSFLNVLTSEGHPPYILLSTSRANGISALAYLKKFFHEVVKGRRDYENLLPMTIGINTNKL